jgi:hypothetical protein
LDEEALVSFNYPNGAGESLGDQLVTCKPLWIAGNVPNVIWYVNSNGGVDAASPAGRNREKPLATLAQAVTNASDNDIIVLMTNHTEAPITGYTIAKKLIIVGAGSAAGKPTVKMGSNGSGITRFTVSAANVEFRNIWFLASAATNTNGILVSTALFRCKGCYFELGANDNYGLALASGADSARVVNTTFISTAASVTTQPNTAMRTNATVSDLELDGVTFSAGQFGFSNPYAFDTGGNILNRIKAENVDLLLGADANLATAGNTGYFNPQLATGGSTVAFL